MKTNHHFLAVGVFLLFGCTTADFGGRYGPPSRRDETQLAVPVEKVNAPAGVPGSIPSISGDTFPIIFRDEVDHSLSLAHIRVPTAAGGTPEILASMPLRGVRLTPFERVVAVGKLNESDRPGVLIQDYQATGVAPDTTLKAYLSNGTDGQSWSKVSVGNLPADHHAAGILQLNRDEFPEILVRAHDRSRRGQIYVRTWQNGQLGAEVPVGSGLASMDWRIATGTRTPDHAVVFFQNRQDGTVSWWSLAESGQIDSVGTLAFKAPAQNYDLIGPAFAHGRPDPLLLFRDLRTSALLAWKLNAQLAYDFPSELLGTIPLRFTDESGEPDFSAMRRQYTNPPIATPNGDRYTDYVPKTLDLAERAELAIHAMVGFLDSEDGDNMLWDSYLDEKVPIIRAGFTPQMNTKFFEAIALLRMMTGSSYGLEFDQRMLANLAKNISRQGLYYLPIRDRATGIYNVDHDLGNTASDFSMLAQVRALSMLKNYYLLTGKHVVPPETAGDLLLQGLNSVARPKGSYAEFWYSAASGSNVPGPTRFGAYLSQDIPWDDVSREVGDGKHIDFVTQIMETTPRAIYGAADYFGVFQNPLGKLLSQAFSNWIYFGQSEAFLANGDLHPVGPSERFCTRASLYGSSIADCPNEERIGAPHLAVRTKALNAMLRTGIATGNQGQIDFVEQSFLHLRAHPSSRARFGYFPEYQYAGRFAHQRVEADGVADMIDMAVLLSTFVPNRDYWDDVDHWVRNQFAEMQVTQEKLDLIKNFRAQLAQANLLRERFDGSDGVQQVVTSGSQCRIRNFRTNPDTHKVEEYRSTRCKRGENVTDAHLGAWASYASANAWGQLLRGAQNEVRPVADLGVMNCCLANAARTLYVVWNGMYQKYGDGLVRIHLLLNRASPELDLYSWLPFYGRVDVRGKPGQPQRTVELRMPEWVPAGHPDVRVSLTNAPSVVRGHVWNGRYIRFALNADEQLRIDLPKVYDDYESFTMPARDGRPDQTLRLRFRGATIVKSDPPGLESFPVNGNLVQAGVPFYDSYRTSIDGADHWSPPAEGDMMQPVIRFLHVPPKP